MSFFLFFHQSTNAEEIPTYFKSPRALGMGNTGVSFIDDEGAQFYNPANLVTGKSRFKKLVVLSPFLEASEEFQNIYNDVSDFSGEATDLLKKIRERGYPPYHLYIQNYTGIVFKRTAFGIVNSAQIDSRILLRPTSLIMNASATSTTGAILSIAHGFLKESILVGMTGKCLYRAHFTEEADLDFVLKEEYSDYDFMSKLARGYGFGADFGATYKMIKEDGVPTISLTVMDIGGTDFSKPTKEGVVELEPIPMTINLGLSIHPASKYTLITLGLDYLDILGGHQKNVFKKIHLGGEIRIKKIIGAYAGFNQGFSSFGGFIDFKIVRFDAGVYTEEMGEHINSLSDKRYFGSIKIGY